MGINDRIFYVLVLLVIMGYGMTAAGEEPLELPIVLELEGEMNPVQAGAMPWFSRNEVSFDRYNRPYIRSRSADRDATGFIHTLRGGRWVKKDFTASIREAYPNFREYYAAGGWTGSRIVFDADDHLYTLVEVRLDDGEVKGLLLLSRDYGESFEICELPRRGGIRLQYSAGSDPLPRPPLVGFFQRHRDHPSRWGQYHNFWVAQPEKTEEGLIIGELVHVTDRSLSHSRHSGEPSFAASFADRTIFTWSEMTEDEDAYGSPVFVATFYPDRNELGERHQLALTPPPNDGHNTPGLVVDSRGYVHMISGAHGMNFYYARTLVPETADEGWTEAQRTLHSGWITRNKQSVYGHEFPDGTSLGRQTYPAWVCGPDDTLHLAFRQWRQGTDPYFDGEYYGALSYQRKPAEGEWSEAQVLVVPPVPGYSIHYQKMSIDRRGRLYLSFSHFSQRREGEEIVPLYDPDLGRYRHRAVIMSDDGGQSWRAATTEAFAEGISTEREADGRLSPVRLEGRVVDSDGRPVEGAKVSIGLFETFREPAAGEISPLTFTPVRETSTDAKGRFSVDGILAAEIGVVVEHADHNPAGRRIAFGVEQLHYETAFTLNGTAN